MKVYKKNNRGFTLVELMVTVGIIGLLGAISVPAVNKYRQRAVRSAAKVEAQALMNAFQSCLSTADDIFACANVNTSKNTVNIDGMLKDVPDTIDETTSFKGVACHNGIPTKIEKTEINNSNKGIDTDKRCYFATDTSNHNNTCFVSIKVTGGYVAWHCFEYDATEGTVIDTHGYQSGLSTKTLNICDNGECLPCKLDSDEKNKNDCS